MNKKLPLLILLLVIIVHSTQSTQVVQAKPTLIVDEFYFIDYEAEAMYQLGTLKEKQVSEFNCDTCEDKGYIESGDKQFRRDCDECDINQSGSSGAITQIVEENEYDFAKNTFTVYYIGANWCAPCNQTKPQLVKMDGYDGQTVNGYKNYRVLDFNNYTEVDKPHFVMLDHDKDLKFINSKFGKRSWSLPSFVPFNETTNSIGKVESGYRSWNQIVNIYYNGYNSR